MPPPQWIACVCNLSETTEGIRVPWMGVRCASVTAKYTRGAPPRWKLSSWDLLGNTARAACFGWILSLRWRRFLALVELYGLSANVPVENETCMFRFCIATQVTQQERHERQRKLPSHRGGPQRQPKDDEVSDKRGRTCVNAPGTFGCTAPSCCRTASLWDPVGC